MKKILKQWIAKLFHSNTIFIQLLGFTLIVSIVPIIIISSLLFNEISNLVENTLNKSYAQLVAQYMSNMDANFFRYHDRLDQIANNTIIIDELLGRGSSTNPYVKGEKVSLEIGNSLRLEGYKEFRNCMIYSNIKESQIYGSRISMLEEGVKELWYLKNRSFQEGTLTYTTGNRKDRVLSLIEDIQYIDTSNFTKRYLGFVKLDIDPVKLFQPVKESTEEFYPYDIIVLDKDNQLIYASNDKLLAEVDGIDIRELKSNRMIQQNGVMVYGDTIDSYGLKILFLFEGDLFIKEQARLQKSMMPMIILLVGFIVVTIYCFTRNFSKRVEGLVQKFKLAEEGNFNVTEEIGGNDEIALLDKQFNHMLRHIDKLIQKNYIQQLEKKASELRNLQLQINPHFLYNTLETISALAAVKGAFEICDLCEKLGDIFRYSLGKNYGEYVTIRQELKHTQNYIFIQKARFGEKFEVYYEVEEALMEHQILRFILQPIVENAIVHGLGTCATKGKLTIFVGKEGTDIIIKVEDNGVGMTKERLALILEYINDNEVKLKNRTRSIGIRNVHQRIRLVCGNDYGINIQSELNQGSCFTIRLPFTD
ncbi:MAG: sensor histidine kinase [Niameybacter sp.]|uniref:sensor histidine kinase n=1 Tax=Niameybacter sp. TaxID=2033640 RepID=UPI002FC7AF4A